MTENKAFASDIATKGIARRLVWITGVVQGVGFRPFVYRLAHDHGLSGWVRNTSAGVEIDVEGSEAALKAFVEALTTEAPPLARIESVEVQEATAVGQTGFEIRHSAAQAGRYQLVSPDVATCRDCQQEILTPDDCRYRYPFTNCTNCGPRFTIIQDIPYDRPKTTMAPFIMCPDCQAEYDDPLDRRFHAQPNACPVCGPHLSLTDRKGRVLAQGDEDALQETARRLDEGQILAIKGLGGFHLACDATNPAAVGLLRQRKHRPHKPLAVMMATMKEVENHCDVGPEERGLLTSPQCPIVLLPWRAESTVCAEVAPKNRFLGVMLPYTPLHHILLRDVAGPLVMTSGNLSEEPIAQNNKEALKRLGDLADAFLLHNREIYSRYDDSVWFVPYGGPQPIRRSRGYAPFPIHLPEQNDGWPQVLACGPELKNTFCLTRDEYAFLSQHIGDMENLETLGYFEETIALYQRLFRIRPEIVAHDLHPEYLSTKYALELAAAQDLPTVAVQHHYAHVVAAMTDNNLPLDQGPVIGVALDGTGYGADGRIWGGEFLIADYHGYQRAAHLQYLPLPGGEAAIKNPYRLALAYHQVLTGESLMLPHLAQVTDTERTVIRQQVAGGLNTPLTSSCGRWFDAVAALLNVRLSVSYEAQAAIELEMLAHGADLDPTAEAAYPFDFAAETEERILLLDETWRAIIWDLQQGKSRTDIAWRIHWTLAQMILTTCQQLRDEHELDQVVLTGGCFQNRLLLSLAVPILEADAFQVWLHQDVPCNDGCAALGQAIVAGVRSYQRIS